LAAAPDTPKSPFRDLLEKRLRILADEHEARKKKAAVAILEKLLEPDPRKRLGYFDIDDKHPMKAVLNEPFLIGQSLDEATLQRMEEKIDRIEKNTKLLKRLGKEHRSELRLTRQTLIRAVFEATEVETPTAFIVLEDKLPDETEEQKLLEIGLKDDGSGFKVEGKAKEFYESAQKRFDKGIEWVNRLKTMAEDVEDVARWDLDTIFGKMQAGIKEFIHDRKLYFYLVDELTGKPVRGTEFEITAASAPNPLAL
jgi:hypothetical protein